MLDSQAGQIRAQAVQESERLAREKNASLQLLQKVPGLWGPTPPTGLRVSSFSVTFLTLLGLQEKEKLAVLERRYHALTGGRPFPKSTSTLKEVTWGTVGGPEPVAGLGDRIPDGTGQKWSGPYA